MSMLKVQTTKTSVCMNKRPSERVRSIEIFAEEFGMNEPELIDFVTAIVSARKVTAVKVIRQSVVRTDGHAPSLYQAKLLAESVAAAAGYPFDGPL